MHKMGYFLKIVKINLASGGWGFAPRFRRMEALSLNHSLRRIRASPSDPRRPPTAGGSSPRSRI